MVKNLFNYPEIINLMAEELFNNLNEYSAEISTSFFIPRIEQARNLYGALSDIIENPLNPKNIIIKGDPGVGKTSFVKWFLSEYPDKFGSPKSFFLDLETKSREGNFNTIRQSILRDIIRNLILFLESEVQTSCNDVIFPPPDEYSLGLAFETLCERLNDSDEKCWILFIDDIDYVDESYLNPLMNLLVPLLTSRNCSIVLATRIPAYNTIMNSDLTRSAYFDADGLNITLTHLDPEYIARERLKLICSDTVTDIRQKVESEQSWLQSITRLWSACSDWLSPPLPDEEDIENIKFPFTERQYKGMAELCNGNIRHILLMCKHYLIYLRDNPRAIIEGSKGYHIGRERFIQHFSSNNTPPQIKILDLNSIKSHQFTSKAEKKRKHVTPDQENNSLYVCILEHIHRYRYAIKSNLFLLSDYGFTQPDIDSGINDLRRFGMIEETEMIELRPVRPRETIPLTLQLTDKGRYYLTYMMKWPEYISKYGFSQHLRSGKDPLTKEIIMWKLLGLSMSILKIREECVDRHAQIKSGDYKINKNHFNQFFTKSMVHDLTALERTHSGTTIPLSSEDIVAYLINLDIISHDDLESYPDYLFFEDKIIHACEERSIPNIVCYYYDNALTRSFVIGFTKTPEYEEE